MFVTFLECSRCGARHARGQLHNLCTACGKPLLVRYDLEQAATRLKPANLLGRVASLWRYRELLPVADDSSIVSLGEGWTPLLRADRLGGRLGMRDLFVKDESTNPTGSFKARGMTAAVSMDNLTLLISGGPPSPEPGAATLFNNCSLPLKLMSPTNPSIDGIVLDSLDTKVLNLTQDLHRNAANTILVAPQTTTDQCTALQCSNWTDILYAPPPPNAATNTKQREGAMWEGSNALFAAYCQPTNAAADQCTADSNTPCCGPNMNFDKTFGTTWEISPFSSTGNDFIDLSTNFGSGPTSPPQLCGPGVDPNDCVTASANIFFNVPIAIDMSGSVCSCGSLGSRSSITCTQISCTDAFQHPTDDKQCACSSGGDRGYLITYCPAGSPLPSLPGMQ